MLDFEEYERCVDCLFTFELSPVLIECFYAIFARGRVNRYEDMTPEFLMKCRAYIEEQCSPSRDNTELLKVFIKYLIYALLRIQFDIHDLI